MTRFITGTFYDAAAANKAVDAIVAMDYPLNRINIIVSSETRRRFWNAMTSESRRTNATSGTTFGKRDGNDPIGEILARGGSGGKASARSSDGANVAAPTVLAGPVAVALAAEGDVNASSQSLLRALVRFGLPRGDADQLQNEIDSGGIIVGVSASDNDRLGIERALRANAARHVVESMTVS